MTATIYSSPQATANWLIFRIGRVACAVPAITVNSILPVPAHVTVIPGADAGRPGLFHYDGGTVAIIDLRHRFGCDRPDPQRGRLLLGRSGVGSYGYWVDSIVGLADAGQVKPAPLPPELPHNVFTAALRYQDEIVLCSDLARLLAMRDAGGLRQLVCPPPEPPASPIAAAAAGTKATAPSPAAGIATAPLSARSSAPPHDNALPHADRANRAPTPAPTMPVPPTTRRSDTGRRQMPLAAPKPSAPAFGLRTATVMPAPQATAVPKTTAPIARSPDAWVRKPADITPAPSPIATEETPRRSPRYRRAVLALLPLLAGGWLLLRPAPTPSPPAPSPVAYVAPEPVVSTSGTAPPPTPSPAPPVTEAAAPVTQLFHSEGIQVEQTGTDITIIIERARSEPAPQIPEPARATPAAMPSPTHEPGAAVVSEPVTPQMYVHTVVKGDTLWAIAEHYLDDPWRYKELAQLSRIRNPDLIYPGNTVRIVIR
jgi:chemotaxis signal transduction protein/nucleoid-associated protein YgaU